MNGIATKNDKTTITSLINFVILVSILATLSPVALFCILLLAETQKQG